VGSQRLVTTLAELSVVVSTAVALLSIFGNDRTFIIAVGLPLLFFGAAIVLVIRRLYSVVTTTVTIAVGGSQGVGKTIYINVLCNQLTEGHSHALSFIPETRTAQRVFRAVGNLQQGQWPSTTGSDRIDYYRGTVGYNRNPIPAILVNGRQEFKVEFGDAAGENWDKLAGEANRDEQEEQVDLPGARLIESSFFTYVGESDSLFYLIDAALFSKSSNAVSESVDDLLSTVALLRTIEGRGPRSLLWKPISIILSKIDLLDEKSRDLLHRSIAIGSPARSEEDYQVDKEFARSLHHIRRLRDAMERQASNYKFFMVSSLAAIQAVRFTSTADDELKSDIFNIELPLEWTFQSLRKLRLFRARTRATW
jgi:GTPase SAR1 family protein